MICGMCRQSVWTPDHLCNGYAKTITPTQKHKKGNCIHCGGLIPKDSKRLKYCCELCYRGHSIYLKGNIYKGKVLDDFSKYIHSRDE